MDTNVLEDKTFSSDPLDESKMFIGNCAKGHMSCCKAEELTEKNSGKRTWEKPRIYKTQWLLYRQ
jgi:hypothetical protein